MVVKTKEITKENSVTEIIKVKQIVMEKPVEYQLQINSSSRAREIGISEIGDEAQEVVLLIVLNTRLEINAIHRVFQGSLSSSIANPREIFRSALMNNGAKIMLFHNHPSQNLEPSDADLRFTHRIVEAGKVLDIELIDHIIVNDSDSYSLTEHEYM